MADKQPPQKDATVETVRRQQHTGNHEQDGKGGADRFGGTRAGAENVEPAPAARKK
ncbi:hypothetical protein EDC65_5249 [Stella humosa]|uniref:Uncharacterized protein n=1 Tax=Stella humosa TaxID=94 RepID=A0A3N1KKP3_9PROT|nr:hypothetical protein [Stella humosa]ROP81391.1 hypothetical protein EDC65_5249 [Stella humosa]BBK32742.1 hypothetical protein STHU_33760 [Stella humosa]